MPGYTYNPEVLDPSRKEYLNYTKEVHNINHHFFKKYYFESNRIRVNRFQFTDVFNPNINFGIATFTRNTNRMKYTDVPKISLNIDEPDLHNSPSFYDIFVHYQLYHNTVYVFDMTDKEVLGVIEDQLNTRGKNIFLPLDLSIYSNVWKINTSVKVADFAFKYFVDKKLNANFDEMYNKYRRSGNVNKYINIIRNMYPERDKVERLRMMMFKLCRRWYSQFKNEQISVNDIIYMCKELYIFTDICNKSNPNISMGKVLTKFSNVLLGNYRISKLKNNLYKCDKIRKDI